jgi:hypothetical protein
MQRADYHIRTSRGQKENLGEWILRIVPLIEWDDDSIVSAIASRLLKKPFSSLYSTNDRYFSTKCKKIFAGTTSYFVECAIIPQISASFLNRSKVDCTRSSRLFLWQCLQSVCRHSMLNLAHRMGPKRI